MKTNGTLLKSFFLFLLVGFSLQGISQPDYIFRNPSLLSGSNNDAGAKYRFNDVKPGIDAIVDINYISPDVKIIDFDDNKNGGFDEAFQPRIQAKGNTSGYAEFTISFVLKGSFTPALMGMVNPTSIDVDGSKSSKDSMMEFDEYMTPGTYLLDYDMVNTDLQFVFKPGSVTGKNRAGLEKPLIDTLAKEAMFGVVYPSVSSITIRIGLDNQLNGSSTRQRSVYFMRFAYANSFLPINNLLSFSGHRNSNKENVLNWKMNNSHEFVSAVIEKSNNGTGFSAIGEMSMKGKVSASFTDNTSETGTAAYYRLKMMDNAGFASYSTVIYMKATSNTKLGVYPSIVNDHVNINYTAAQTEMVSVLLFDQSGRVMIKKDMNMQNGMNTVSFSGLAKYPAGQYYVVVKSGMQSSTQRIQLVK